MLDNNQWRLGHRRPWWQWNVLTLFAILFVLVWVREFFGVSYNMILLVCSLIVFLWLVVPIGSTAAAPRLPQIESQPSDASNDDSEDELASPRKSSAARALTWLVVAILIIKLLSSIRVI